MFFCSVYSLSRKDFRRLVPQLFIGLILLGYSGISWGDEPLGSESSGALAIESKTALYSANIHIKGENATEEEKNDDKKRNSVGIGESFTLTLTGKPLGDLKELTWEFVSGKELVEETDPDAFKGKTFLQLAARKDLTPEQLKNHSGVKLTVTTGEGRVVPMKNPMIIVFPTAMTAKHIGAGTPIENSNNRGATEPSAWLRVTLQPTDVAFKNIKIIERDLGSVPDKPRKSLDEGHAGHGNDVVIDIDDSNKFKDRIKGIVTHQDILQKVHVLPQDWIWKCSWRVHKGNGGPIEISGKDDVGQIGGVVKQTFNFYYIINQETGNIGAICGQISKFGCTAVAYSDKDGNHYDYPGPAEADQ